MLSYDTCDEHEHVATSYETSFILFESTIRVINNTENTVALDEINRPLGTSFSLPRNSSQVWCCDGDSDLSSSMSAALRQSLRVCNCLAESHRFV